MKTKPTKVFSHLILYIYLSKIACVQSELSCDVVGCSQIIPTKMFLMQLPCTYKLIKPIIMCV